MTDAPLPPHTRRSAETWAAARADYEAGASAAVVAERYGLALRSVRRHAHDEGWRRVDDPAAGRLERLRFDPGRPELGVIDDLNGEDAYELLFAPKAGGLADFAFRRAAESAALGGPRESAAWLRVAQLAMRLGERHDVGRDPYSAADLLRADMMRVPDPSDDEAVDETPEVAEVADVAAENRGHFDPGD